MSDMENKAKQVEASIFLQNLVKLIPVEIIALFAIINGFIPATANPTSVWIVLGLLTVIVPFYIVLAMGVTKWTQVVLMTVAFPIWVAAIGGFPALPAVAWFEPWMVSVGLALFTLIPPMFYGKRVTPEEIENNLEVKPSKELDTAKAANLMAAANTKSWREV